jgi:hypothetical protein
MRNFLIVCAVAVGLFVPLSLVAQDQRPDGDRGRNQGYGDSQNRWQGRLPAEDQARFDSYYSRWLSYRQNNDQDQMRSMEGRMRDVMSRNNIPGEVPFEQIASNGNPGYQADRRPDGNRDDHDRGRGDDRRPQWQNRMSGRDQARFNSYYSRWLDAGRSNNRHEIGSMEKRMRGLMAHYSIPQEVRFSEIATGQGERY